MNDQHKNQDKRHIEETNKENQETENLFPTEDVNEDGTVQFPSETEGSTDELNPNDQRSMTTESGLAQSELDYEGFTEEDQYSSEEAGEAGGFTSTENNAALEEKIADDQNRQGGDVNLKSTNRPLGKTQDGEETENL